MAVSRALRRLLRIRDIEEEQGRLALESALGDLRHLENALAATVERARSGRRLVGTSAHSGELPDRLAGLEETRAADRRAAVLVPRIADAELRCGCATPGVSKEEGRTAPGRDPDPGDRGPGCRRSKPARSANARRLVWQQNAPGRGRSASEQSSRFRR